MNLWRVVTISPMLKSRIITAAFLVPLVIVAIFYLPSPWFMGIAAMVFSIAHWEWTRLAGFKTMWVRGALIAGIPCLALAFLGMFATALPPQEWGVALTSLIMLFWSLAGLTVYFYPKNAQLFNHPFVNSVIGVLILFPSWASLSALQAIRPMWVLYLFVLIWGADSAAYFTGKRWGKHRLAPNVSPGKSWEGVLGALLSTQLISSIGYLLLLNASVPVVTWMLLNSVVVAYSIIGDLFESLFKRARNLKDSGGILPGHGGILDRIDSLTAAAPIFVVGVMLLIPGA